MCIKIVMGITFANVVVYCTEIFPSVYRAIGVAGAFGFGRIGGVIAPFVCSMLININILPQYSFGIVALVGMLVLWPAKETKGAGFDENIHR